MRNFLLISLLALSLVTFLGSFSAEAAEPNLEGVAYIQTHGGHVSMVDLATGNVARYVHGKDSDALTLSKDGKTIYVFSLDGYSREIDQATGKMTDWVKLGGKHCGSNLAPDGTIWVSDMKEGMVYVYDPKTKKLQDKFKVSKSTCGISFSNDGKTAYVSDMPGAFISVVDVKSRKVVGKFEGVGDFIHRHRLSPDGTELWQSDGRELKGGEPYGVGYVDGAAAPGMVRIVDAKSGKLKDSLVIGGNPHDVDFTPDGKYAIIASRQLPEEKDSALVVVDTKTKRVVKMYSACKKCHGDMGVEIEDTKDKGKPFLCAVEVNWKHKKLPAAAETP